MHKLVSLFVIVCSLLLSSIDHLNAQDLQPKPTPEMGSGLSIQSLTIAPQSHVAPGGILIIRCLVRNTSSKSENGYLVGRIKGQIGEEDRYRVALQSGETKSVDVRLRVSSKQTDRAVEVIMTLNLVEVGREILAQTDGEPIMRTLRVPIMAERNITTIALNSGPLETVSWRWPAAKPDYPYEFVVASRIDASCSRQCIVLDNDPLPLNLVDWENINLLVVANSVIFDDAASVATIEQYLHSGGRVWVMLDEIETDSIQPLLQENQQIETLDTVELNRFEIEVQGLSLAQIDRIVDRDDSIQMKRVLQSGGRVTHSVDGWPAAIWMPIGRGELLITTLSSPAWLGPRQVQKNDDLLFQSAYMLPIWAASFANQTHNIRKFRSGNLLEATYPIDRIGNPVVSRLLVASVLVSFCLALIAIAAWRFFGGRLTWIGVLAPALSILASIPLVAAALTQRRDIPSMVSTLQLVEMESKAGTSIRESAAVYTEDPSAMELIGKGDGLAEPAEGIESGIRSVITDDFQNWRLKNDSWPAGTWRYKSETSLPELNLQADAYLTNEGLSIELPRDLPTPLEDIVVSFVPGAPTLGQVVENASRFIVTGNFPAESERWTTSTIVSDEQRRRAAVYSELLGKQDQTELPLRTMSGWTELWQQAPRWNSELERRGTALVTIPVRLLIPEVGSQIHIPHCLIHIENADMQNVSSAFKQETGRFIEESTLKIRTELKFTLPEEAVPLEANALTIDWDIKAPKRTAKLSCLIDGAPIELATLKEPSIPWKMTISDPRILKELKNGLLIFRIEVSGIDERENSQGGYFRWRIKHLRLSVDGRTLPRNTLVATPTP